MCHRPVSDCCHGEGPRRRLLLRLTSPRTRRVGGEAWPSGVIPAPPGRLAAACRQDPLPWQRHARTRVPQSQPPPPQRLQRCKSVTALIAFESVPPGSAGCPSPAIRPGRALRRRPAACRLPPLGSAGRLPRPAVVCGPFPGARRSRRDDQPRPPSCCVRPAELVRRCSAGAAGGESAPTPPRGCIPDSAVAQERLKFLLCCRCCQALLRLFSSL